MALIDEEQQRQLGVRDLIASAMPKEEIGALRFLQEHPEYDGRGVKICIFDTGVDPGAAGLQVTTDGKPKIIDVVDCTGAGDVDVSRTEKADADGCITGASGRKLKLNPEWTNPSGEWRVGVKHVYNLLSRSLVARLKDERRKKWEEGQRTSLADAVSALAKFDRDTPASKLGDAGKRERAELEQRVTLLKELTKGYEDPGPVIDCVVWHDGSVWRAALDTSDFHEAGSGKGDLAGCRPLTNYATEHQYGTFSELDSCNYAVNLYDEGRTLSIVVDCGAHGTHVAGIAAAHFPDDPDSNGIAPGAQIISLMIGDTRLGSMETGVGVVRAIIAARQHGAHLINMSYGEPTTTPNQGRLVELASELVHKHNIIFVSSAGNSGPALSTVGAPGGTSSALFAVGAYVSSKLAGGGHSALDAPEEGLQYNWSSRGPAADGHVGVAFSAPGGAIAPVPQWTQQRRQLMNGTSMSSPNACGGIALLLSGLLARQRAELQQTAGVFAGASAASASEAPYTPARIRRALENTATPLGGSAPDAVLTYGRGLIQIDKAWDYLMHDPEALQQLPGSPASTPSPAGPQLVDGSVRYELEVACAEGRGARGRGVYMREPHETAKRQAFKVTVTPKLHEDAANTARLAVEDRLSLEPSSPWIQCPPVLLLHSAGRTFDVVVDPTGLPPGLHYGEVAAYEVDAPRTRGPLFRLPVTVICPVKVVPGPPPQQHEAAAAIDGSDGAPMQLQSGVLRMGPLRFSPGDEHRTFVAVPAGAAWAELTLRAGPYDTPKLFLIRATQLRPEDHYKQHELRTQVTLSGGSEYIASCEVVGRSTLELTLAQFWSSSGPSTLEQVELAFYGVELSAAGGQGQRQGCDLELDGAALARKVLVSVPTWSRSVRVKPEAKLHTLHIPLRPSEATLEPAHQPRDDLGSGRVAYRLALTYKYSVAEGGKYKPCLPLINKQIYDSPLESQLLLLHDGATKQLLASTDAHPEYVTLKKGCEVVLRLLLRHDSQELLDKMRGLPMVLKRKLDSPVALPVYGSRKEALMGAAGLGSAQGDALLRGGDCMPLWLGPLPEDKLPKDATPGRRLTGSLSLGQLKRAGGGAAPQRWQVSYVVPPAAVAGNGNGAAPKDEAAEEAGPEAKLRDAVRDAQIKVLKELKLADAAQSALYSKLLAELRAAHPGHLPLLTEHLKKMDGQEAPVRKTEAGLGAVVAAADEVIGAIDGGALAAYLGLKVPEETPESRRTKKDMDERKGALVDALARKAGALLELEELAKQQQRQAAAAPVVVTAEAVAEADAGGDGGADEGESAAAAGDSTKEALPAQAPPLPATAVAGAAAGGAAAAAAPDAFLACLNELRKWVDTSADAAHLMLHAKAELRAGRLACAIKALDKLAADEKSSAATRKEVAELKASLYAQLGWAQWAARERALLVVRFPKDLPLL